MRYNEESDHAFIIRIWKENRAIEDATPLWRGSVEHVASGSGRFFQNDMTPILAFIHPYLEEMGFDAAGFWQWRARLRWFCRFCLPASRNASDHSDAQRGPDL